MRFVVKRLMLFVAALIGLSALVFVMLRGQQSQQARASGEQQYQQQTAP